MALHTTTGRVFAAFWHPHAIDQWLTTARRVRPAHDGLSSHPSQRQACCGRRRLGICSRWCPTVPTVCSPHQLQQKVRCYPKCALPARAVLFYGYLRPRARWLRRNKYSGASGGQLFLILSPLLRASPDSSPAAPRHTRTLTLLCDRDLARHRAAPSSVSSTCCPTD